MQINKLVLIRARINDSVSINFSILITRTFLHVSIEQREQTKKLRIMIVL